MYENFYMFSGVEPDVHLYDNRNKDQLYLPVITRNVPCLTPKNIALSIYNNLPESLRNTKFFIIFKKITFLIDKSFYKLTDFLS